MSVSVDTVVVKCYVFVDTQIIEIRSLTFHYENGFTVTIFISKQTLVNFENIEGFAGRRFRGYAELSQILEENGLQPIYSFKNIIVEKVLQKSSNIVRLNREAYILEPEIRENEWGMDIPFAVSDDVIKENVRDLLSVISPPPMFKNAMGYETGGRRRRRRTRRNRRSRRSSRRRT